MFGRKIRPGLVNPSSIAIFGNCKTKYKIGGAFLQNLVSGGYAGRLTVVDSHTPQPVGEASVEHYPSLKDYLANSTAPADLALMAIPATRCNKAVEEMISKGTKNFVVASAGYTEVGPVGVALQKELKEMVEKAGGSLLGPNCIGVMTPKHDSLFTQPEKRLLSPADDKQRASCDFASSSGALTVYLMEEAVSIGLSFGMVFSTGNAASIGVEDAVEYFDEEYDSERSSHVKLLYLEKVSEPLKLAKHISSLVSKGCSVVALKSGVSSVGVRAAASHTGALATPDTAMDALLDGCGAIRVHSRDEMVHVAAVLSHKPLGYGCKMAVITHAGGPGVVFADALQREKVPGGRRFQLDDLSKHPNIGELESKLLPHSSIGNPIDILATAGPKELGAALDWCENSPEIDTTVVILGSFVGGMSDCFRLLLEKQQQASKPVFTVLPSVVNTKEERLEFIAGGGIAFHDEYSLAHALCKLPAPKQPSSEHASASCTRGRSQRRFLPDEEVKDLLTAGGVPLVQQVVVPLQATTDIVSPVRRAVEKVGGFPVVLKAAGVVHKSDVGGVLTDIEDEAALEEAVAKLTKIDGCVAVLVQPMVQNALATELFVGAVHEKGFGHMVSLGVGGTSVELHNDVSFYLASLATDDAKLRCMDRLRCGKYLFGASGYRGSKPIPKQLFLQFLEGVERLLQQNPAIVELDLNPVLYCPRSESLLVADARIAMVERE